MSVMLSPNGAGGLRDLWIGLTGATNQGTFKWTNGGPLSYTNWGPGEPNNLNGNEDYVAVTGTPFGSLFTGSWNGDLNARPFSSERWRSPRNRRAAR